MGLFFVQGRTPQSLAPRKVASDCSDYLAALRLLQDTRPTPSGPTHSRPNNFEGLGGTPYDFGSSQSELLRLGEGYQGGAPSVTPTPASLQPGLLRLGLGYQGDALHVAVDHPDDKRRLVTLALGPDKVQQVEDAPPPPASAPPLLVQLNDNIREQLRRVSRLPTVLAADDLRSRAEDALVALENAENNLVPEETRDVIEHILVDAGDAITNNPNPPALNTGLPPLQGGEFGRDAAIPRAATGVLIELSTISLYLYAMYSVSAARTRIVLKGIVKQEMDHLVLAGNLLTALNGRLLEALHVEGTPLPPADGPHVTLYDSRVVPQYGEVENGDRLAILYSEIRLNLEALSPESIANFVLIEAPVNGANPPIGENAQVLAGGYPTIGRLYKDLCDCVQELGDGPGVFQNVDTQFGQPNQLYNERITFINNEGSARVALQRIIDEGEGAENGNNVNCHHQKFLRLAQNLIRDPPPRNVPMNPKTLDYEDPFVYRLSLSFDAAYCYLLQTIQRVWETNVAVTRQRLLSNIQGLMVPVLQRLATLLIKQDIGNDTCAAPCFNYYPMSDSTAKNPVDPERLHEAIVQELQLAIDHCTSEVDRTEAQEIVGIVQPLSP